MKRKYLITLSVLMLLITGCASDKAKDFEQKEKEQQEVVENKKEDTEETKNDNKGKGKKDSSQDDNSVTSNKSDETKTTDQKITQKKSSTETKKTDTTTSSQSTQQSTTQSQTPSTDNSQSQTTTTKPTAPRKNSDVIDNLNELLFRFRKENDKIQENIYRRKRNLNNVKFNTNEIKVFKKYQNEMNDLLTGSQLKKVLMKQEESQHQIQNNINRLNKKNESYRKEIQRLENDIFHLHQKLRKIELEYR